MPSKISVVNALSTTNSNGGRTVAECLLHRVRRNDRAGEAAKSALPFVVGNKSMGLCLDQSVKALSQYPSVFDISSKAITLIDPSGESKISTGDDDEHNTLLVSERSKVVEDVLVSLREQDIVPALRGWRDEPFAVRESFASSPELIVERAAAVLFGVPAYGVFVNGYTCEGDHPASATVMNNKPTHVWIGTRASTKATWPSRKDSLAAGGLAAGMQAKQAMMNECQEEAGIPHDILQQNLKAVSAISYTGFNEDMWGLKRDVLFCFDLQLPIDFIPAPVDGEMDSFEKIPIQDLIDMLCESVKEDDSNNQWKPNVGVVLIDFLVRHGILDVDDPSFLELVDSLRGAKCA